MPATEITLRTPWPRAFRLGLVGLAGLASAAVSLWWRRRATASTDQLPSLDDRMMRDMGLPDWVRHDLAERREARLVERVAAGMPVDWTR